MKYIKFTLSLLFLISSVTCAYSVQANSQADKQKEKNIATHRSRLNDFMAKNKRSQALKEFSTLVALTPNDGDLRFEYGMYLAKGGNKSAALPQLKKAFDLDPANEQASGEIGSIYYKMKNYQEAAKYLRFSLAAGGDYSLKRMYEYSRYQHKHRKYLSRQAAYKKKVQKKVRARSKRPEYDADW